MNGPFGRFTLDQLQDGQRLIARAWADDAFKAALLADPMATLAAEGFAVPDGMTIAVHENSEAVLHVVLPPKPRAVLSDEDLAGAAGGFTFQVTVGPVGPVATGAPISTSCAVQSCVGPVPTFTNGCNGCAASGFP